VIRYCPSCASRLATAPPSTCDACGYALFVNPRPTGSVIICDGPSVLIVQRARDPKAGEWDLPGGFCDGWEVPAAAAVREAREELGVEVALADYVGMYLGSYDFQGETVPVLDCFWLARIVSGELRPDPSELLAYRWVPLAHPPRLAFPSMDAALADAQPRLTSRV
jgi:8-oxo-dGTP diphosphatase